MSEFFRIINSVNDWLWTYVVIVLLVFCAIYFTVRIRGVQFRLLKDMWRVIVDRPVGEESAVDGDANEVRHRKIGSFQAFAVSLSSRVGTGNLAGVASAICVGGPGAVFWMWIMALFGAATAFIEATLAQLYKRRGKDSFYGGPAYYMQHGLHRKWMGLLFAVLLILTFGIANQLVQSNTLCDALGDAFSIDKKWIGLALAAMTLVIIFGGIHRISHFASIVVPFMAIHCSSVPAAYDNDFYFHNFTLFLTLNATETQALDKRILIEHKHYKHRNHQNDAYTHLHVRL